MDPTCHSAKIKPIPATRNGEKLHPEKYDEQKEKLIIIYRDISLIAGLSSTIFIET